MVTHVPPPRYQAPNTSASPSAADRAGSQSPNSKANAGPKELIESIHDLQELRQALRAERAQTLQRLHDLDSRVAAAEVKIQQHLLLQEQAGGAPGARGSSLLMSPPTSPAADLRLAGSGPGEQCKFGAVGRSDGGEPMEVEHDSKTFSTHEDSASGRVADGQKVPRIQRVPPSPGAPISTTLRSVNDRTFENDVSMSDESAPARPALDIPQHRIGRAASLPASQSPLDVLATVGADAWARRASVGVDQGASGEEKDELEEDDTADWENLPISDIRASDAAPVASSQVLTARFDRSMNLVTSSVSAPVSAPSRAVRRTPPRASASARTVPRKRGPVARETIDSEEDEEDMEDGDDQDDGPYETDEEKPLSQVRRPPPLKRARLWPSPMPARATTSRSTGAATATATTTTTVHFVEPKMPEREGSPPTPVKRRPHTKRYSRPGKIPCDHPGCPARFTRPADMVRHRENIHNMEEGRYRCPVCEKSLSRQDAVKRHLLQATDFAHSRFVKKRGREIDAGGDWLGAVAVAEQKETTSGKVDPATATTATAAVGGVPTAPRARRAST
jgi:hypothetical protein